MPTTTSVNNQVIIDAFKAAIRTVQQNPGATLKVTFQKADGSIRNMNVAHDAHMKGSIKGTGKGTEKRAATNDARGNLVVRELLGDKSFQWRTIPLSRVKAIVPVLN